ncbi:hypothetical protein ABPG74_017459 [Tetrahymena malaccensis]
MFNIYQFENELKEQIQYEKKRVNEEKWKEKRQIQKDQMVENYKKRLNQFLSEMKQKPIKIYDDIVDMKLNLVNKFRPEDESKIIGPKVMRIKDYPSRAQSPNYVSNKQSQNMSLDMYESNKSLNQANPFIPFKPYQFRSREKNKELYGDMKFKASYKNERVVDQLFEQGIGGLRSDHPYVPQTAPTSHNKKVSLRDQIGKIRIRPSTTKNDIFLSQDNSSQNLEQNQQDHKDNLILMQNQLNQQNNYHQILNNSSIIKEHKSLSNNFVSEMYANGNNRFQKNTGKNRNKSLPQDSNSKSLTSNDMSEEDLNILKKKDLTNTLSQKNDLSYLKQNQNINLIVKSKRSSSIQINDYLNSQKYENNQLTNNININNLSSQQNKNTLNVSTPEKNTYQNQMQKLHHHNNSHIKGQNILPILHQKTHFKALTELAIQQPLLKSQLKEVYDENLVGNLIETNQIFDDQVTSDAMQIMNDCNIFRTKHKNVKGIRGTLRNTSSNFSQNNYIHVKENNMKHSFV